MILFPTRSPIRSRLALLLVPGALLLAAAAGPGAAQRAPREVKWKKTVIDTKFRSEGAATADVNKDGKRDILVGDLWYEAPDWKAHEIRPSKAYDPLQYSEAFLVFGQDVDQDGWPDEIVIGFPGAPGKWYRNPGNSGEKWTEHTFAASACNESPLFVDLDGDRRHEVVTPFQEKQMAFYRPEPEAKGGWKQHLVGEEGKPGVQRFSHGLGAGDVNGDGKTDILTNEGYYEQPAAGANTAPWKFVPAKLGPNCAQMYTHDFDGDGDMDVISSSAHAIGFWWYEQKKGDGGTEWVQHTIDNTFSQSHALMMADINGDRQPDFITGKRWWAHGPNGDVNPGDPAVLYWFEYRRSNGKVEWIRHEIDNDSGVGTGFNVADMNRDRRRDIVVSNKKGVFIFEQTQ